ncbi:hypothetical protein ACFXJ5_38090 [Streptomyces sp. NPDC059373]
MEQQKQHTSLRLVVVDPDLDAQCDRVEEHLLVPLNESTRGTHEHALYVDAVAAFRRLRGALAEAVARGPQVWTPNGRWEHEGLRLANVPTAESDLLYDVLRKLSGALVARSDPAEQAGAAAELRVLPFLTEDTVGALARVLSMMDLVPDPDTATLFAALEAPDSENVRLTYAQEDAWQRLAHRVTMLLTESVPLHRFLY